MALIPRSFLNTVVALGAPDSKDFVKFTATGFLWRHQLGEDTTGEKGYWVLPVTNRKVNTITGNITGQGDWDSD